MSRFINGVLPYNCMTDYANFYGLYESFLIVHKNVNRWWSLNKKILWSEIWNIWRRFDPLLLAFIDLWLDPDPSASIWIQSQANALSSPAEAGRNVDIRFKFHFKVSLILPSLPLMFFFQNIEAEKGLCTTQPPLRCLWCVTCPGPDSLGSLPCISFSSTARIVNNRCRTCVYYPSYPATSCQRIYGSCMFFFWNIDTRPSPL